MVKSRVKGRVLTGTAILTAAIAIGIAVVPAVARRHRRAFAPADISTDTSQWQDVIQAFGNTDGTVVDGILTVDLPRTDLQSVTIAGIPLKPDFAAAGQVTFRRVSAGTEMKFEVALLDDEVSSVVGAFALGNRESATGAFLSGSTDPETVTAIHNHYVKDSPPIKFVHGFLVGNGATIAGMLHDALAAHSATPFGHGQEPPGDAGFDTAAVTNILGGSGMLENGILRVSVERREVVHERGWFVPPEMQISSDFEFQSTGNGQVASIAEFVLRGNEVIRVIRFLGADGITVSAIHNHELNESPDLYYLHAFATGDPATIATNFRDALNHTNSRFQ